MTDEASCFVFVTDSQATNASRGVQFACMTRRQAIYNLQSVKNNTPWCQHPAPSFITQNPAKYVIQLRADANPICRLFQRSPSQQRAREEAPFAAVAAGRRPPRRSPVDVNPGDGSSRASPPVLHSRNVIYLPS